MYQAGKLHTGTVDNVYYVNGVKFTGTTKDGVLYENGKIYNNGVLLTGKHSDGKFYQNGVVLTGYNGNTYYVKGTAANGYMADNTKTKYSFKNGVKQAKLVVKRLMALTTSSISTRSKWLSTTMSKLKTVTGTCLVKTVRLCLTFTNGLVRITTLTTTHTQSTRTHMTDHIGVTGTCLMDQVV